MYLKKSTNKKTGRTYLSIASGYRDKKTGKSKTVLIESLGYLDVLEKEFDDPISHFTEIVNQMNIEEEKKQSTINHKNKSTRRT